jgi:hypothetical protein
MAIAERAPSRHMKTIVRSLGTVSACDARRSSSMWRALVCLAHVDQLDLAAIEHLLDLLRRQVVRRI